MNSEQEIRAAFQRARRQNHEIVRRWILKVALEVIVETPGFGKQEPVSTEYQPTGRLRGGWSLTTTPLPIAMRWTGGPYEDRGIETLARVEAKLAEYPVRFPPGLTLTNDVGYGYIVKHGLGRHTAGYRPWIDRAAAHSARYLAEAKAEVLAGGEV